MNNYTKEQLVNINKTLNNRGSKFFNFSNDKYFRVLDILNFQKFCAERYTNFNGGFGLYSDTAMYDDAGDLHLSFSTDKILKKNISFYDYHKNINSDFEYKLEFNKNDFIERMHWLEVLIKVCEFENVAFRYDRDVIYELIDKCK